MLLRDFWGICRVVQPSLPFRFQTCSSHCRIFLLNCCHFRFPHLAPGTPNPQLDFPSLQMCLLGYFMSLDSSHMCFVPGFFEHGFSTFPSLSILPPAGTTGLSSRIELWESYESWGNLDAFGLQEPVFSSCGVIWLPVETISEVSVWKPVLISGVWSSVVWTH